MAKAKLFDETRAVLHREDVDAEHSNGFEIPKSFDEAIDQGFEVQDDGIGHHGIESDLGNNRIALEGISLLKNRYGDEMILIPWREVRRYGKPIYASDGALHARGAWLRQK